MGKALCSLAVLFCGTAGAQLQVVPRLDAPVPASLADAPVRHCVTRAGHEDPCVSTKIGGVQLTIAWDAQSKAIVYVFTDDPTLVMDSELGVGGLCAMGDPGRAVRYLDWLVTPAWKDTARSFSGDATWYAVLQPSKERPGYGVIAGFVQSRYLAVGK